MNTLTGRVRRRWRQLMLVVVTLTGFPSFAPAAPLDSKPIDRVTEIRSRLLAADRAALAPDGVENNRLGETPARLAQYWRNWPNYWANWPNWPNWPNWRNY